jgi:hypothetical protein
MCERAEQCDGDEPMHDEECDDHGPRYLVAIRCSAVDDFTKSRPTELSHALDARCRLLSSFAFDARAVAAIAGTGSLQGTVQAAPALGQLTVYAYDAERRIGYMVFVVDGRYRATNLFPGKYSVTVRGTPGQRSWSLPARSSSTRVVADKTAQLDFAVPDTALAPTYVGGMTYADATIAPYDEIYPPGEARQVLERVCFGCHTTQLYPYNVVAPIRPAAIASIAKVGASPSNGWRTASPSAPKVSHRISTRC